MSVRTKLFIAMGSFIMAMSLFFVLLTQLVVRDALEYIDVADRSKETGELSRLFAGYYEANNRSWDRVGQAESVREWLAAHPDASLLLEAGNRETMYETGSAAYQEVTILGIRKDIALPNGEKIATLYYHDPEAANIAKIQIGISSSVSFLLTACAVLVVIVSLVVAYLLAKRLTAPLRLLLPAIDRLGKGELGVQAPIVTKDEYGKVAAAFNEMSVRLGSAESNRRNLVADVAHELRTPLTIVRGKLDLVQQSGQPVEPESLLPLQDELIRLTRLVDDLHQLSLAEARRLPLERKPTSLAKLLSRVVDHLSGDAEQKDIRITMEDSTGEIVAHIDPNRMTQVFLNLLVNAVRYTPSGGSIGVRLNVEPAQGDSPDRVRIEIADSGTGIAEEHLPLIFNRFYRTDDARARSTGGMGLGLAIAKEFVLAHGGTIEAHSSPGQGTTFIVRLPVRSE